MKITDFEDNVKASFHDFDECPHDMSHNELMVELQDVVDNNLRHTYPDVDFTERLWIVQKGRELILCETQDQPLVVMTVSRKDDPIKVTAWMIKRLLRSHAFVAHHVKQGGKDRVFYQLHQRDVLREVGAPAFIPIYTELSADKCMVALDGFSGIASMSHRKSAINTVLRTVETAYAHRLDKAARFGSIYGTTTNTP